MTNIVTVRPRTMNWTPILVTRKPEPYKKRDVYQLSSNFVKHSIKHSLGQFHRAKKSHSIYQNPPKLFFLAPKNCFRINISHFPFQYGRASFATIFSFRSSPSFLFIKNNGLPRMLSYGDDTSALLWVSHLWSILIWLDGIAVNKSLINGTIKVSWQCT